MTGETRADSGADTRFPPWSADRARAVVADLAPLRGALMPMLHALQREFGYVDGQAVPLLADILNLSVADVHGVVTFYRDFRDTPPRGPVVRLCRAEACQAVGSEALAEHAERTLAAGGAAAAWELDEVYCLGNCALGPSATIDGRLHAGMDAVRLDALLAEALGGEQREARRAAGGLGVSAVTVYVPRDAAARSVGADKVAAALAQATAASGRLVNIVRNGSRGMLWLEPLVEVATAAGRVAYGPVSPEDLPGLLDAGLLDGGAHPLRLGPTEDLPWMRGQQRVTFARVGLDDPLSLAAYEAQGGWAGLRRALAMAPVDVVKEVTDSGLRGRGGAGFPAGIKWNTVAQQPAGLKFVCANADEGDSGTFADRMLMEGDPFSLIEGMAICAHAVGASEGYIYLRSEYPDAIAVMGEALERARAAGWLGASVAGSGMAFDIFLREGAGSYICGEETAMLESLEGKRGVVRAKPPLPAIEGLFGRPTVVNNVLTLATVPAILADGAAAYQALGMGRSRGTQVFQLGGNVKQGGIVERAFGVTLRELVEGYGGGTFSGRPLRAVQVGGPLGAYLPADGLDLPMDYEALAAAKALLGHGGVVLFDDTVDMARQARFAMAFCAEESCGKCTPCRIGAVRGVEVLDRIIAGEDREANLILLSDLCEVMTDGSLCAMGGLTPLPVRSALAHFGADFQAPPAALL